MNYALIKNQIVMNVIVADDDEFIQLIMHEWDSIVKLEGDNSFAGIGWSYIDGQFLPPEVKE